MSIFANKTTKVLVQGITGTQASFHTQKMLSYGTNIVAGVSPNRGGAKYLDIDVFNTVKEAVDAKQVTASVMFVPARFVKNAVKEAIEAELETVVTISAGVPNKDIGIVSRSSTLTYEAVLETKRADMGQSTVLGLGDDMIVGTGFVEIIDKFHKDEKTKAIIMIGQQGGTYEEAGAEYYASLKIKKPIIGYVAGSSALKSDKMGYAGDINTRGKVTPFSKKEAMRKAGIIVVDKINEIHKVLQEVL